MRKTVVDRFGTHARKKLILAIWLLSVVFSVDAQQRKKVDGVRAVGAEIIIGVDVHSRAPK